MYVGEVFFVVFLLYSLTLELVGILGFFVKAGKVLIAGNSVLVYARKRRNENNQAEAKPTLSHLLGWCTLTSFLRERFAPSPLYNST